jgi:bifunctional non-homologous end joining protein LigD
MPKPLISTDPADIFQAARAANPMATRAFLDAGAKVDAVNDRGFTALECAAMGTNGTPVDRHLAVLRLLIEAGSPLEHRGAGGRTALYLAAEFSRGPEAIQLLLDAGAQADIRDEAGNHVVENAMMPEVKSLLSRITGHPIPKKEEKPEPKKMTAPQWRAAREKIDAAFDILVSAGIVALHDAGETQDDGFADASEAFRERGGFEAGLIGMCFYTRQDLDRAKRSSDLALAFWGGPEGEAESTKRVGRKVVEAFQSVGLPVRWNGSEQTRPIVDLRAID